MGILGSRNRDTESGWWKYAADVMQRDEQRVTYAHVRCFDSHGGLDGTLFLTDRQVIWRVTSPGPANGDGFQSQLEDILGMGRDADQTPGVFGIAVTLLGQAGGLTFAPQRMHDPASVALSESIRDQIDSAWKAAKSGKRN